MLKDKGERQNIFFASRKTTGFVLMEDESGNRDNYLFNLSSGGIHASESPFNLNEYGSTFLYRFSIVCWISTKSVRHDDNKRTEIQT